MTERQMEHAFVNLLLEKGARVKLKQEGKEMGIAGTRPEIYAVDKDVLLTREEVEPMIHLLVDDRLVDRRITTSENLRSFLSFEYDPDFFSDDDPPRPRRGAFADFSK